jgi:hypothetical protein
MENSGSGCSVISGFNLTTTAPCLTDKRRPPPTTVAALRRTSRVGWFIIRWLEIDKQTNGRSVIKIDYSVGPALVGQVGKETLYFQYVKQSALDKLQQNTDHKMQFMISMKLLHVSAPSAINWTVLCVRACVNMLLCVIKCICWLMYWM